MSGSMIEFEETSWESVMLQRIFLECDTYWSKKHEISTVTISREVPILAILEYVKDNLPSSRLDLLVDLRKCLADIAPEGFINWEQFRESSQHWLTKIESFGWQDDNNNAYKESQRIVELRTRIRQFEEENDNLREETSRAVELLTVLRRQRDSFKRELDRCTEICQQLDKENDERKDALNDVIRKERASNLAHRSSIKKCESLQRKLEAAELEVEKIATARNELIKMTKENAALAKQMEKTQNDFDEKQQECVALKMTIDKIEETCASMRQAQEQMFRDLREKNRQLVEENSELQSLSTVNTYSFEDRFRTSPYPNIRHCSIYDALSISDRGDGENSLFLELKASGFTTECGRNDSRNRELEEELETYDVRIRSILKQVEGVVQDLAVIWKTSYESESQLDEADADCARTQTFKILARKTSFLVRMVSDATSKSSNVDACTQVEAQSAPRENLRDFGIVTFHDVLNNAHRSIPSVLLTPFVKPDIDLVVPRSKERVRTKTPDRLGQYTRVSHLEKEIGRQKIARTISAPVPLSFSTPVFPRRKDTVLNERRAESNVENHPKHEKRRRRLPIGCPVTETNNNTQSCTSCSTKVKQSQCQQQDASPILSGLANAPFRAQTFPKSPEPDALHSDDASEEEIERKYTTFSIGLRTDRMTVNSRLAISTRQRDLAERELTTEIEQMQKDIQGYCQGRVEGLEGAEGLHGRLEVVDSCWRKICRASESVGAVQQERRFLEAVLTADRHLQVLRARCRSLAAEVDETKWLLRNSSSLTKASLDRRRDGVSKIYSRAGLQVEIGSRKTEDTVRHSSRLPGKVRLRRRQNLEPQERESEISKRTKNSTNTSYASRYSETSNYSALEHSNRVDSLEEKKEQAVDVSDTPSIVYHMAENSELWSSASNKPVSPSTPAETDARNTRSRASASIQRATQITKKVIAPYRSLLWYVLIFFMGFYVNHIIRVGNTCQTPSLKWWSMEEILSPYFKVKKKLPPPI